MIVILVYGQYKNNNDHNERGPKIDASMQRITGPGPQLPFIWGCFVSHRARYDHTRKI